MKRVSYHTEEYHEVSKTEGSHSSATPQLKKRGLLKINISSTHPYPICV